MSNLIDKLEELGFDFDISKLDIDLENLEETEFDPEELKKYAGINENEEANS